jgi:hypothetical protein
MKLHSVGLQGHFAVAILTVPLGHLGHLTIGVRVMHCAVLA